MTTKQDKKIKENLILSAKTCISFCDKQLLNKELSDFHKLYLLDLKEKQSNHLKEILNK